MDAFREWECTHNRENYGRADAYFAGHASRDAEVVELRKDCQTGALKCLEWFRMYGDLNEKFIALKREMDAHLNREKAAE